jgi:hypothetical protein
MKFSDIFKQRIEPSLVTSSELSEISEDGKVTIGFNDREITLVYNGSNTPDYRRIVYKMTMLAVIGMFPTYADLCQVNKTFEPKSYKHECVYQRCKTMTDKLCYLLGDELFDTIIYAEPDLDDIYGD